MSKIIESDALIIGAGPVGLFAVFELGLMDIKCHLVDVLDKIGGQCAELYPEKPIYDIPAIPHCTGQELIDDLMKQIKVFEPKFFLSQMVETIKKTDDNKWLVTSNLGEKFLSKIIIIATGGGSFMPKKLSVADAEIFEGESLFYSVQKMENFKGRDVVISGGGDSALDWTIALQPICKSLTLIHRSHNFKAAADSVNKVMKLASEKKIEMIIGRVKSLKGKSNKLESLVLSVGSNATNNEIQKNIARHAKDNDEVKCDKLLAFHGLTMKLGPVANWGLNLHENLIPVDTEKFETNEKTIFAIGDINYYPGKLKLILSGFHEAALMARKAFDYIYPDRKFRFQYTTSSSEFQKKLGVDS